MTDYVLERGIGQDLEYLVLFSRIYSQVPGLLQLIVEIGASTGTESAANVVVAATETTLLGNFELIEL
ncbi:MAG: hypothetical protein HC814_02910 [Rhodobacteraceae bacterium]|nr:hypothetical protein [Paracoccaceae bacterium]